MLVRFARNYGWRAYAIPVLIVITVWVLVDVCRAGLFSTNAVPSAASAAATNAPVTVTVGPASLMAHPPTPVSPLGTGPDPANHPHNPKSLVREELPPGGPYTTQGSGLYHLASRGAPKVGKGEKKTFSYTVEVEEGLNPVDFGGDDAFAAFVNATLSDPRSWTHDPRFAFVNVTGADGVKPDFRIQLTSTDTTHTNCGTDIHSETSCYTPMGNRVIVNEARWVRGAFPFEGDLGSYRRYVINHEVGHAIGYRLHEPCGKNGALAPVMMQQTLSLSNDVLHDMSSSQVYPKNGAVCRYNSWPYPTP